MKNANAELSGFVSRFRVRRLTPDDLPLIFSLSAGNPQFYRYCPPAVTRESILQDMRALPPGKTLADKFYLGFFEQENLIAVMDLIFGYPDRHTAFLGLFMMRRERQGQGIGSAIIRECFDFAKQRGMRTIRLAFAKGNRQSEGFWKKNGFEETGVETDKGAYTAVVLQKRI